MISREANLPRKAMRVAIPLFVDIDGRTYAAHDWSTTGVGLAELERVPDDDELLAARLSFPMLESTLLIPVQLRFRGLHEGIAGFEFHELSARNRRILRHYIELSLDGKLGDVDDIVAVAALVDRSAGKVKFGIPFVPLIEWRVKAWPADKLPPHLRNIPAVKPGSRGLK